MAFDDLPYFDRKYLGNTWDQAGTLAEYNQLSLLEPDSSGYLPIATIIQDKTDEIDE